MRQRLVAVIEHRHRREPHQRSVAGRARVGRTREWILRVGEVVERLARRVADVEAFAGRAQMAVVIPVEVAVHLVDGIESVAMEQAVREAQRHRGVVGPLAGLETERPAADHVGERLESSARLELDRRADGITAGEAEQAAAEAIESRNFSHAPEFCTNRPTARSRPTGDNPPPMATIRKEILIDSAMTNGIAAMKKTLESA